MRGIGAGAEADEREQTLNQLLSVMDGFDQDTGVIVIGATNRRDILDPALIRPGRFDRLIRVSMPDIDGREAILRVHLKDMPVDPNLNLREVASECQCFAGAQLANLVNVAAMYTTRHGREW